MLEAILEEQNESMLSVSQNSNPPATKKQPSNQQPNNSVKKDTKGKVSISKKLGASKGVSPKK